MHTRRLNESCELSMEGGFTLDKPFALTCPECGGALFPAERAPAFLQCRCHIGHKYIWTAMLEATRPASK